LEYLGRFGVSEFSNAGGVPATVGRSAEAEETQADRSSSASIARCICGSASLHVR